MRLQNTIPKLATASLTDVFVQGLVENVSDWIPWYVSDVAMENGTLCNTAMTKTIKQINYKTDLEKKELQP